MDYRATIQDYPTDARGIQLLDLLDQWVNAFPHEQERLERVHGFKVIHDPNVNHYTAVWTKKEAQQ